MFRATMLTRWTSVPALTIERRAAQFTDLNVEPVRLFDNLYFVGLANVYAWIYDTPEGFKAYAAFSGLSERIARRALEEFLPRQATNPDRISGIAEAMADAVTFKFLNAPLSPAQIADLIRIPERRP